MIRDPSDGTVKHQQKPLQSKDLCPESPVLDTGTSGLPISKSKADYLARLEESRKWLLEYKSKPDQTVGE